MNDVDDDRVTISSDIGIVEVVETAAVTAPKLLFTTCAIPNGERSVSAGSELYSAIASLESIVELKLEIGDDLTLAFVLICEIPAVESDYRIGRALCSSAGLSLKMTD